MRTKNRKISSLRAAVGLSALAAAMVPITAYAQNADPAGDEAFALDEIVVTAQFRRQRLQDTPIAMTAVTGDMMEARNQTNLIDLSHKAPNVTIQPAVAAYGGTAAIAIRGVGQWDRDFALEPGVGIYIDDVYYPTVYGAQLDLLDLDRVEISRGPQGTLAGKNSIGGAIKLYSRRPSGSGDGFVEATYGSSDHHQLRASVDVPVVENTFSARIAGVYKERDGHIQRVDFKCRHRESPAPSIAPNSTGCELGKDGGESFRALRLSGLWTPTSNLEVYLTGDIYSDGSGPTPSRLVEVNPDHQNAPLLTPFLDVGHYESYSTYQSQRGYGYDGENSLDGHGVSGQIDYTLPNGFSLTSITAHREYDGIYQVDLDGTSYGITTHQVEPRFRQFTQEVRLNGTLFDDLVDFTAGGFYYDARGINGGRVELSFTAVNPPQTPPPAAAYHLQDDTVDSESLSAFLHTVVRPTDKLSLSLGLRYTDEEKTLVFHRLDPVTFAPQTLDGVSGRYSDSYVDYRAALDYKWAPEIMTYISFATGQKGGGITSRPYRAEQVVPFGPESVKAYEVGLKSRLFDRSLRFNVSAFFNDYDDIQLTIRSGTGIFTPPSSIPVNAGKAEVKGIEFETDFRPVESLALDASFSYLDFDYTSLSDGALASGLQYDFVTPFNPKWKWSAGAQYDFQVTPSLILTPRFDVSHQSHIYSEAVNSTLNRTNAYTVANGRITLRDDDSGTQLALAVTNIFDNYYYTSQYDNLYGAQGTVLANVARPREWWLTLKHSF